MPTLLILDDSNVVRQVIRIYLAGVASEFLEAGDAERGLQLCRLMPVDLVIADIKMPGKSGIDFVRAVRADPNARLKALPIVLLTGESSDELRVQGLAAGANAFVKKPVLGPALRDAVAKLLKPPEP